jgi:hypothetical protein
MDGNNIIKVKIPITVDIFKIYLILSIGKKFIATRSPTSAITIKEKLLARETKIIKSSKDINFTRALAANLEALYSV